MKYTPPYSIESGSVYEYCEDQRAYVHIYKKSQLNKNELQYYRRAIAVYDAKYDTQKSI